MNDLKSTDFVRIYGVSYKLVRKAGLERLNAMSDDARRLLLCAGAHAPGTAAVKAAMHRVSAEGRLERERKRVQRAQRWKEPKPVRESTDEAPGHDTAKKPVATVVEVRMAGRFRAPLPCLEHGHSVERMMELARKTA